MEKIGFETLDGNEAVARVAFQLNEVIALFPITPASPMGEWAVAWAAAVVKNLWGTVPLVTSFQTRQSRPPSVEPLSVSISIFCR